MLGMEKMLASMLGISEEQIEQMREQLPQMVAAFNQKIATMEAKLQKIDNIDNNIRVLYRLLVDSNVIKPVPSDPSALPAITSENRPS
jgi:hypothetical protein